MTKQVNLLRSCLKQPTKLLNLWSSTPVRKSVLKAGWGSLLNALRHWKNSKVLRNCLKCSSLYRLIRFSPRRKENGRIQKTLHARIRLMNGHSAAVRWPMCVRSVRPSHSSQTPHLTRTCRRSSHWRQLKRWGTTVISLQITRRQKSLSTRKCFSLVAPQHRRFKDRLIWSLILDTTRKRATIKL